MVHFPAENTHRGSAENVARLEAALERFLWWGQQQCPCYNDEPSLCPLCGASIENLEGCKAVEAKFPPIILGQAREAIARSKSAKATSASSVGTERSEVDKNPDNREGET
jgi:hypothetical protein